MAKSIDPALLDMMKADLKSAPRGGRIAVMKRWSELLDISVQTLYKAVPTGRVRAKGVRKIEGIEQAALLVAQVKSRPPEHRGQITTADAVEIAVANGLIPADMAHVGTFDRVIRDIGANKQRRRIERYQAERPNEMHHVDASSSNCFYVHRELPDGDYMLRIYGGTKDYKNKPVPIRLRPWIYGVADDHSGMHLARYIAALGESAADNLDFLSWAWAQIGLPEKVKGDHGPMMSSDGIPDWFERLGIQVDPSEVLNKDAHGKIERPWRTMWQRFELPFFAESNWKKFEIPLSELNERFVRYQKDYNEKPHRFERTISRRQAWARINQHGGMIVIPADALKSVVKRWSRKVGQDGCFSLDNEIFEVKGLHDAWVWVYRGMFEEKMVVVHQETGAKYEVEDFAPNRLGEYSQAPESTYQQVRKAAVELDGLKNTLYTEDRVVPANVRQMPTRIKEVRTVVNPLNMDTYPDIEKALWEFQGLCGFILDRETRAEVKALIEAEKLSRRFVSELALDLQMAQVQAL
jgi:transposase InsO family protein